jgi:asparagine synthetase A
MTVADAKETGACVQVVHCKTNYIRNTYWVATVVPAVIRTCSNQGCHFEFPAIRQRQRERAISSDPFSGEY